MMENFETMPLRFRVWDKEEREFVKRRGWVDLNFYAFAEVVLSYEETDLDRFGISQDTGLKDKNGKSIYTGDIVEWERHSLKQKNRYIRGVIVYKFAHICMEVKTTAGKKEYAPIWGILPDLKIISSIWQNPELLEEK